MLDKRWAGILFVRWSVQCPDLGLDFQDWSFSGWSKHVLHVPVLCGVSLVLQWLKVKGKAHCHMSLALTHAKLTG